MNHRWFQSTDSMAYQQQFNFEFMDAWIHWDLIPPTMIQDYWAASDDFAFYCMGQEL